jgi:succinate dehydrogenase / fumarate reductase flavoprotein subunit
MRNMRQLAREITVSALAREESRGGHYRADFPTRDPALEGQHQVMHRADGATSRRFGALRTEPARVP